MFEKVECINNLSKAIETNFGCSKNSDNHLKIYKLCLEYVLKIKNASKFQSEIKALTGKNCGPFRLSLIQSIYVLRNIKAYIVHFSRIKKNVPLFKFKYDLAKDDYQTCSYLSDFVNGLNFESEVFDRVCDVKKLDSKLNSIISEVKSYCELFIRKKLLFVLKSCNYEIHDLSSEMLCKAIISFYHTSIECRGRLHTLNFLRMTCKNHGTNMINYFTAKKRSRLNKVGENEFSLTIVSENQFNSTNPDSNYENLSEVSDDSNKIILRESVKKIVSDYSKSNNASKVQFVKLLMGYYDKNFSDFLAKRGIRYKNNDYIDRVLPKTYVNLVVEYLNLTKINFYKLISSLKLRLA